MATQTTSPTTGARQAFPRWFLIGVGAMMLVAIVGSGLARVTGLGAARLDQTAVAASVELWFDPQPDGTVVVRALEDGRVLEVLPADGSGFIRGVMRSQFRQRMLNGQNNAAPFRLVQGADGGLFLEDLAGGDLGKPTGAPRPSMKLDGFGPTNSQAFARLLAAGRATGDVTGQAAKMNASLANPR